MQTSQEGGRKPNSSTAKSRCVNDDLIKRLLAMGPIGESDTHRSAPKATGIEVLGDDMMPGYQPTTKIYCEKVAKKDWRTLTSGVYVIALKGCLLFGRIRQLGRAKIELYFENPAYAAIALPISKIICIYKGHTIYSAPAR